MARFLSLFLLLSVGTAWAAESDFHDPTRPPDLWLRGSQPTTADSAPVETPLVLQSIMLSAQRKAALISGQPVMLGQSIRGYRLESLTAKTAVLYGPKGTITLKLLFNPDSAERAAGMGSDKTLHGSLK